MKFGLSDARKRATKTLHFKVLTLGLITLAIHFKPHTQIYIRYVKKISVIPIPHECKSPFRFRKLLICNGIDFTQHLNDENRQSKIKTCGCLI